MALGPQCGYSSIVPTPDFTEIPQLDRSHADEIFSPSGDPSMTELQADIWAGVRANLENDLPGVLEHANPRAELHKIRGSVVSAGLGRLGAILEYLERQASPEEIAGALPSLLPAAAEALAAFEEAYPHLAQISGGR